MKLILAIINYDDANEVIKHLTDSGFQSTKLASTGGFLKAGNVTILVGVEDETVDRVVDIIRQFSHSRKQLVPVTSFGGYVSNPIEVAVGGATIFILEAAQYVKL